MNLVAVSQRVDCYPDRGEKRDALDQRLVVWLREAGCFAAPVPNALWSKSDLNDWLERVAPAAILLSGGNDLAEVVERDHTETLMLDYAAARRLPVLGLCRGMQMLIAHAGGTLESLDGHVATRHALQPASPESAFLPDNVNSYHRWGVRRAPGDFVALAHANDGSIEAVRHNTLPWEGWMWHPERENPFCPADAERFRHLLADSAVH
jgi:putative glutamine amidotransferase